MADVRSDVRSEILAEIRRIAAAELSHSGPVEPSHRLAADLGVDSIGAVVLAVGLEDRFRIRLSDEDTEGVVTVEDLVAVVCLRIEEAHERPGGDGGAAETG